MVFTRSCKGIQHLEHLPPLPLCWSWHLHNYFSHKFSLLSPSCCGTAFSPLCKQVITEVLTLLPNGSALASDRSVLEPAEIGFIQHEGSFWHLFTEANAVASPAAKTLPLECNTHSSSQPAETNGCYLNSVKLFNFILRGLEMLLERRYESNSSTCQTAVTRLDYLDYTKKLQWKI